MSYLQPGVHFSWILYVRAVIHKQEVDNKDSKVVVEVCQSFKSAIIKLKHIKVKPEASDVTFS